MSSFSIHKISKHLANEPFLVIFYLLGTKKTTHLFLFKIKTQNSTRFFVETKEPNAPQPMTT